MAGGCTNHWPKDHKQLIAKNCDQLCSPTVPVLEKRGTATTPGIWSHARLHRSKKVGDDEAQNEPLHRFDIRNIDTTKYSVV
ncbi:hypothetical protein J6590_041380 [Homalodisca vitripennis]|nr:hypothetical protein J6590_041380 [Homalodisca vitripennis]